MPRSGFLPKVIDLAKPEIGFLKNVARDLLSSTIYWVILESLYFREFRDLVQIRENFTTPILAGHVRSLINQLTTLIKS